MYDHLYSDSQNSRFGQMSQLMLSLTFKRRMKSLVNTLKPDAVIFTHPFPAGAADLLKAEGKSACLFWGLLQILISTSSGWTIILTVSVWLRRT